MSNKLSNFKEYKQIKNDKDYILSFKGGEKDVLCRIVFNDSDKKMLETDIGNFSYSDLASVNEL